MGKCGLGRRAPSRQPSGRRNIVQISIVGALGCEKNSDFRFSKHLLFYRRDEEEILILRVVHGARDLERLL